MALFMFLAAPMGAMSMLIVRKVSFLKAHKSLNLVKSVFFRVNKLLFIVGFPILLLFWIGSAYFGHYLRVDDASTIIIIALMVVISIFYTACMAFLQGLQRLVLLGIFGIVGVMSKIFISIGLIKVGFGIEGALLGVLFSMLLVLICTMLVLFKSLPSKVTSHSPYLNFALVKQAIPLLVAVTVFAAMTQLDMIIINYYFSPDEAGLYAAAAVLGKAVLYLPGGLILVLFPMVSESHAKGDDSFLVFRQAVFFTILTCGTIATIYWFFGNLIIYFLYGESYVGAGEILRWYGLAILPLTVVMIAEQYLIAKGQVLFAWIFLLLLPLQFLAIYLWHTDIWMILVIMGSFGLLLATIGYGLMWRIAQINIKKVN